MMARLSEQDESYLQTWQTFRTFKRVADGRHDTADWRARRGPYAGCILRVPAATLQPSFDEFETALDAFPFTRVHPDHFLHIMLQELGFVCERPQRRDEISPARVDEFIEAAASAVANVPPFTASLGGANSFQDAVFLDVHDNGGCARLHSRLHDLATVTSPPRYAFVPHATIAHYTEAAPINGLVTAIGPWRDHCFGTFAVTRIEVVTLSVDAAYPPLTSVAELPLGD